MRRAAPYVLAVTILALAAWLGWGLVGEDPPPPKVAAANHPKVPRQKRAPRATPPTARVAPAPEGVSPLTEGGPPEPARAAVYGRVRGAEKLPDGAVVLEGCGLSPYSGTPVDADGEFFAEIEPERCAMRAWRQQGALRLPGAWVDLDPRAGVDTQVDLAVPTFEPAGMGITFRATGSAVSVLDARPGTPAAEAGLSHGDQILLIDGQSTEGMDQEDFLQHGIGEAGSSVRLEGLTGEGEAFDVVLTRRPIHLD